uniref:Uncharacterized protein n=1 Tax=Gopherus agassizii TaxID=38772 RepID=A0A452HW69_9SAUR
MHDHQQGGAGDQDELQGPEADVGDREEVVITDVGAAGRHHVDQEAEDEDHGEPDAPEGRGVLVHPAQELLEPGPIHPLITIGGEGQHDVGARVQG